MGNRTVGGELDTVLVVRYKFIFFYFGKSGGDVFYLVDELWAVPLG